MAHHTKDKGDIAVGMVIADLLINGYTYAPLISEHLPFDLIVINPIDCSLRRLQVKYCSLKADGKINFRLHSAYADRHGSHMKPVDRSLFDAYAIFCPELKLVYYVNNSEIPEELVNSFTLRVTTPKNNQIKGINFVKDFIGVGRIF